MAFCRRYAAAYNVAAVWYRRRPVLAAQDQTVVDPLDADRLLLENDHPVFAVRGDLTRPQEVSRVVYRVLERFGRIDVVVNAAAYYQSAPMLQAGMIEQSAAKTFEVNVLAPVRLCVEVARLAWQDAVLANQASNRCVVNVSSTAGLHIHPGSNQSLYGASKAALNHLTLHMAHEFAPLGIRVNALAPDAFPGRIDVETVLCGLQTLIDGDITGHILVLDVDRATWLP